MNLRNKNSNQSEVVVAGGSWPPRTNSLWHIIFIMVLPVTFQLVCADLCPPFHNNFYLCVPPHHAWRGGELCNMYSMCVWLWEQGESVCVNSINGVNSMHGSQKDWLSVCFLVIYVWVKNKTIRCWSQLLDYSKGKRSTTFQCCIQLPLHKHTFNQLQTKKRMTCSMPNIFIHVIIDCH